MPLPHRSRFVVSLCPPRLAALTAAALVASGVAFGIVAATPSSLQAQSDSATTVPNPTERTAPGPGSLGLSAVGAFTAHAGAARVQRGFVAGALGGTLDFGYLRHRRVRVTADLTYLLTAPKSEFVASENASYRDVFRDLSGHVAFAFHANDPSRRISPYVVTGAGVDVLSSTFNSLAIDTRYNSNNLSLLGALGTRVRLGRGMRRALTLELRGVAARNARRAAVHIGVASLFNDLAPRPTR